MRKQLDPRIPILINNNVKTNHRSFIVLVGDKGRDQVRLHYFAFDRATLNGLDCQPALSPVTSARLCTAFGTMVLQKGLGLHKVRRLTYRMTGNDREPFA